MPIATATQLPLPPRLPLINPFGPPTELQQKQEDMPMNNMREERNTAITSRGESHVLTFVSGIDTLVSDEWIRKILDACGEVISWRRAYGSNEQPQSFGFCEFKSVKDAVCAVCVLSSTRGLRKGGWVLSILPESSGAKPLDITVDNSMQSILDAHYSAPGLPKDAGEQDAVKAALGSVEKLVKEFEISVKDKRKSEEGGNLSEGMEDGQATVNDTKLKLSEAKEQELSLGASAREPGRARRANTADVCKDGSIDTKFNENAEAETEAETDEEQMPFSLEGEESWEKEQLQKNRYKRYVFVAEERENRINKEQSEREERLEWNAMRELDRVEERQRARDAMADMLAKWDDSREEESREHEYYRDRERWWHHRRAVRAREIEQDDMDRRRQKDEEGAAESTNISNSESTTIDRRTQIEALIQEIPTDKDALFAWPVKWEFVNNDILHTKIEPAVHKHLSEYLGNDTDDSSVDELAEFIIGHIHDHNSPSGLVDELEMVLVDEAPVFVARIWRVVVYESEAQARNLA
ncbi:hypothetical protein BX070DRAFT_222633 [Coemansia spiralis]|nr:hypothetical protein BX070DRAFT_222633 [Coemansia spiralis]